MQTVTFKGSSNIRSATFTDATKSASVEFANGSSYRVDNFSQELLDEWAAADSAGSWFDQKIKKQPKLHPVTKLPPTAGRAPDLHHSQGTEISEVLAAADKDREKMTIAPSDVGSVSGVLMVTDEGATGTLTVTGAAKLAVEHDTSSPVVQAVARGMYESYLVNSGGLAWDGKPCPTWEQLNNAVRSHWCAAAREAFRRIAKLSACDVSLESR